LKYAVTYTAIFVLMFFAVPYSAIYAADEKSAPESLRANQRADGAKGTSIVGNSKKAVSTGTSVKSDKTDANKAKGVARSLDPGEQPLRTKRGGKGTPSGPGAADMLWAVACLAIVLAMIVAVVAVLKRFMPSGVGAKSGAYLHVMAKTHLSPKHSINVVRFGSKILLVGMTPTQLTCLGVFDPLEMGSEAPKSTENPFEKAINVAETDMTMNNSENPGAHTPEDIKSELQSIIEKVSEWRNNN